MAQQGDLPRYITDIMRARTTAQTPMYAPKRARGMTDESRTNAIARGQGSLIPQGYTYADAMRGDLPPTLIGGYQNPEMFDSQTGRSTGMRRNDMPIESQGQFVRPIGPAPQPMVFYGQNPLQFTKPINPTLTPNQMTFVTDMLAQYLQGGNYGG
jgi:hypothetical protein